MVDTVVCRENYGSSSVSKVYVTRENGDFVVMNKSAKWTSVSQVFRSVFLPQGYPESVSSDYLTYQIWDTIQAFASSITGTLAAQAVLKGVGVGDENATVLAATMTWIIKDGTGMLGRILFAWLQGTSLDCDAKRWRLFADILNDFAIFVEILAPNFPGFFRPIICTSGVCKSIVGVAGGATRAALTQHQARRNNMADVSAKDGSQETLVNLAALLCSLVLIPLVTGREMVIWTLFVIFTSLHLYANYSAVTCVVMETLNQARLHIIVNKYATLRLVPSVVDTNKAEPVVWKTSRRLKIRLGTSLSRICSSTKEMESLLSIYKDSKYLLALNLKKGEVGIVLSVDSDVADHIQSCFQAEIIEHIYCCLYRTNPVIDPDLRSLVAALEEGDVQNAAYHSYRYTCSNIQTFRRKLQENGWLLDPALMCAEEWRARWDIEGISDKKEF